MTPFSTLLVTVMRERRMSCDQLAIEADVSASNVTRWRRGRTPSLAVAARIADALDWPSLATTAIAHWTRRCDGCGVAFVDSGRGGKTRRFCTDRCGDRDWNRRYRGAEATRDPLVKARELTIHQEAVAAFCRRCCPEGVCDQPKCELRGVSPLPLAWSRNRAA